MPNLVRLYKSNIEIYKEYAIKYFISIQQLDKIKEIFNYDNFIINILQEYYVCKNENTELHTTVNNLTSHIKASFDGELYFDALADWNKRI